MSKGLIRKQFQPSSKAEQQELSRLTTYNIAIKLLGIFKKHKGVEKEIILEPVSRHEKAYKTDSYQCHEPTHKF